MPRLCLLLLYVDVGELEEKSGLKRCLYSHGNAATFLWGLVPPLVLWSPKLRGPQTAAALNNNLDGHLASPFSGSNSDYFPLIREQLLGGEVSFLRTADVFRCY